MTRVRTCREKRVSHLCLSLTRTLHQDAQCCDVPNDVAVPSCLTVASCQPRCQPPPGESSMNPETMHASVEHHCERANASGVPLAGSCLKLCVQVLVLICSGKLTDVSDAIVSDWWRRGHGATTDMELLLEVSGSKSVALSRLTSRSDPRGRCPLMLHAIRDCRLRGALTRASLPWSWRLSFATGSQRQDLQRPALTWVCRLPSRRPSSHACQGVQHYRPAVTKICSGVLSSWVPEILEKTLKTWPPRRMRNW